MNTEQDWIETLFWTIGIISAVGSIFFVLCMVEELIKRVTGDRT